MSDVDEDLRDALERLTDPEPGGRGGSWEGLVARRRRRRVRRTAVTMLPVALFAGVFALTIGVFGGDRADRTEVATTPDEGAADFSPFEMRYAVSSMVNLELVTAVWELDYDSVEAWELTLVKADPALGLEPGRRQVFSDGVLTDYWAAGEGGISDDEVDGGVAPLALMSRGPRTHGPLDGDPGARHEFRSAQTHECPEQDAPPWCEEPGQTVVLDSIEVFNGDGVPVFAEDRVRDTNFVLWRFEQLSYDRKTPNDRGEDPPPSDPDQAPAVGGEVEVPLDEIPEGVSGRILSDLPVFLVRDGEEVRVFAADPRHLPEDTLWWCPVERIFIGVEHGEQFDADGLRIGGPSRGGLNEYHSEVVGDSLVVDFGVVIEGETRRGQRPDGLDDVNWSEPWNSGPGSFCDGAVLPPPD